MTTRPHWFDWLDEPRNVRHLWRGFLLTLVLTVVAGEVVTLHPHFAIEALPAFHAIYGFLACAAMILVARVCGMLLKRPDDYYEADDE